jgi:hypothetical protein
MTVPLSTPVAFFIFNRPEVTARVFSVIAQARPRRLLIAADGPRSPEEAEKCAAARAVVERVDWDCEVSRDYSEKNLGCAVRVSTAIAWTLSQAEEAIFIEDDTLPDPSFLAFAERLLERYRHDERVMHISGDNFQAGQRRGPYSYYFSRYAHGWGWATWRRAWKHYDFKMTSWPEFRDRGLLKAIVAHPEEQAHWTQVFDREHRNPTSWDYQWYYAMWSQNGLSALPQVNLVTNIGYGPEATHTREQNIASNVPLSSIGPLQHPPHVIADRAADSYTYDHVIRGTYRQEHRLRRRLLARLPSSLRTGALAAWRRFKQGQRPSRKP